MSNNQIHRAKASTKTERDLLNRYTNNIAVGFVREVIDPQRMGRLMVWVPEHGPDTPETHVIVSYASPFGGSTDVRDNVPDDESEAGTQKSYGWWAVPPHKNNMVLVAFPHGDYSRGYWFACIYQQNANHMVPAIAGGESYDDSLNSDFSPFGPPVTEYNKKTSDVDPNSPKRAVYSKLATGLKTQGLNQDPERGVGASSARRESPSAVHGLLTPSGNSFVIDDSEENSFIRFRTASGTQIMVSETSGYIYMITKEGKSWVEISDGAIDMFSEAPISIRSQGDLNLIADGSLNLDASGDLNFRAGGAIRGHSGGSTDLAAGGSMALQAITKLSIGSGLDLAMSAGLNVGLAAGLNLVTESGGLNVRNGSLILDNSGGLGASSPSDAKFRDTTDINGRKSISSSVPTHEPYDHPINASLDGATYSENGNGGTKALTDGDGQSVEAGVGADNTPVQKIGGYTVSQKVNDCIKAAAQKTGVSYPLLMAVAAAESSFRPNAGAGTSSARGLFQFIGTTWTQTYNRYGPNGSRVRNAGVKNNVFDPCSNALMGAYYIKENQQILAKKGLATGATEVYICHFLGEGGGPSFLQALKRNPNASAASLFPSPARSNKTIFYNNKGKGAARSLQGVYNVLHAKVGATVPQWASFNK